MPAGFFLSIWKVPRAGGAEEDRTPDLCSAIARNHCIFLSFPIVFFGEIRVSEQETTYLRYSAIHGDTGRFSMTAPLRARTSSLTSTLGHLGGNHDKSVKMSWVLLAVGGRSALEIAGA